MISILLKMLKCILWSECSLFLNFPCELEKNVHSAVLHELFYKYNYILLIDGTICVNYNLTHFLPDGSVSY
jgi:hypothetical protein